MLLLQTLRKVISSPVCLLSTLSSWALDYFPSILSPAPPQAPRVLTLLSGLAEKQLVTHCSSAYSPVLLAGRLALPDACSHSPSEASISTRLPIHSSSPPTPSLLQQRQAHSQTLNSKPTTRDGFKGWSQEGQTDIYLRGSGTPSELCHLPGPWVCLRTPLQPPLAFPCPCLSSSTSL